MSGRSLHADFGDLSAEDSFVGLPQTDFALDSVLETLPRELIQNVYDARNSASPDGIRLLDIFGYNSTFEDYHWF